jgi:hypothetical protein
MHDGACVGGAFVRIVRAAAAGGTPGAHEGVGYAYGLSNGPMGQRGRGRLTEGRRRLAALQRIARHPAWSAASSGQRAWSRAEVAVRLDELELALLRERRKDEGAGEVAQFAAGSPSRRRRKRNIPTPDICTSRP